jgi:predicted permease
LSEKLKAGSNQAGGVGYRAQGAFVAFEVALALVLLVGAGLMIRSLSALWNVNPGFNPDKVLSFGLSLPSLIKAQSPEGIRASLRQLSDDLNSLPGVRAASFSWGASPLQGEDDLSFWIEGQPKPANQNEVNMAIVYRVEPGYLKTMAIPLKRGRFFADQDTEKTTRVAVVDEVFAQKYFANADPIGRVLNYGGIQARIIGVVGHVKQWGLDADDTASLKAQLYESFRQLDNEDMLGAAGGIDVLARVEPSVNESASGFFESIRHLVQTHNHQNVVFSPQTMKQVISGTLAERRFSMILLDTFAVVALLLSSIGIYGVLAYAVTQRTREIGVRMALGATRSTILRLALRGGMLLTGMGIFLGLLAAFGLTRFLANLLYQVKPTDPLTFLGVSLLLSAVALLACWLPARRAAQVEPMVALRTE